MKNLLWRCVKRWFRSEIDFEVIELAEAEADWKIQKWKMDHLRVFEDRQIISSEVLLHARDNYGDWLRDEMLMRLGRKLYDDGVIEFEKYTHINKLDSELRLRLCTYKKEKATR